MLHEDILPRFFGDKDGTLLIDYISNGQNIKEEY
jgi:hypothetical protein